MEARGICIYVLKLMVCLFLFFSAPGYSQKQLIELNTEALKNSINQTEGSQKLKLLDSLAHLTEYRADLKFDSITRETIHYAIKIDSVHLAIQHTANLIFYYANRSNRAQEGVKEFNDFVKIGIEGLTW